MDPQNRHSLARLLNEAGTQEAIEALKLQLTQVAVSKGKAPEKRTESLHMLWGLEALLVKMKSLTGDQP